MLWTLLLPLAIVILAYQYYTRPRISRHGHNVKYVGSLWTQRSLLTKDADMRLIVFHFSDTR